MKSDDVLEKKITQCPGPDLDHGRAWSFRCWLGIHKWREFFRTGTLRIMKCRRCGAERTEVSK